MTIRIVTDSTCDLPAEVIDRYNIAVVPAYINVGDNSYTDGVDITRDYFYANLGSFPTHPSTAAPSPMVFTEMYESLKAQGATEIISIHVAGDLSLFLNAAQLGAEAVEGVQIHIVDSRNASMGLGLQVLAAARALAAGQSAATIVAQARERANRTIVYAGVDTLEFMRRSGRIGWGTAGIGALLNIKPILVVKDGQATSFDRVRTRKKVVPKLVELLEAVGPLEDLAILYSGDSSGAEELKAAVARHFPADSLRIQTMIGPTIGAHVGPDALGFACIAKAK